MVVLEKLVETLSVVLEVMVVGAGGADGDAGGADGGAGGADGGRWRG